MIVGITLIQTEIMIASSNYQHYQKSNENKLKEVILYF